MLTNRSVYKYYKIINAFFIFFFASRVLEVQLGITITYLIIIAKIILIHYCVTNK